MSHILHKHRHLWKQPAYIRSVLWGMLILLAGIACVMASRDFLTDDFIHLVSGPDFLLDRLPVMRLENFIVWSVPLLIGMMVFVLWLFPERLPFTLKSLGVLFAVRAFFIILTPMGIRPDHIGITGDGFFQSLVNGNDFFFSGHVSFPFLLALIFWEVRWVRFIMLVASGLLAAGVLLGHAHYSIDVFSVPLIVPSIHAICKRLFPHDRSAFTVA